MNARTVLLGRDTPIRSHRGARIGCSSHSVRCGTFPDLCPEPSAEAHQKIAEIEILVLSIFVLLQFTVEWYR